MAVDRLEFEQWIFGSEEERRFTQDSPVLPDVWVSFAADSSSRQDLLLTPHEHSSAAKLMGALQERFPAEDRADLGISYNDGYVVAYLGFHQLVREVVPLSEWWRRTWPPKGGVASLLKASKGTARAADAFRPRPSRSGFRADWLGSYLELVGRIEHAGADADVDPQELRRLGAAVLKGVKPPAGKETLPLWTVSLNREARTALWCSRLTVKADAARRVFTDPETRSAGSRRVAVNSVRWAVVDTGVDATHPAFRRRSDEGELLPAPSAGSWQGTRVLATYDFTKLRPIISGRMGNLDAGVREELERRIKDRRPVDWEALAPLLEVEHGARYEVPKATHGTHVAGILAGDWRVDDPEMPARKDLIGVCPDVELYDLRVFGPDGKGEEFAIMAALQFIRHLNAQSDRMVVHGANLSLSLDHVRTNYAVGRSPICDECERLTASGVVVVVAAGNEGRARYVSIAGRSRDGARTVAITDPGNAEKVITVGSTHREEPHAYGVSYFSSRGPTMDGRRKPDLVAPGEKIAAPAPGGDFLVKDGTSQAAAHVSGVAALLLGRNAELVARPELVKQALCRAATDLGRDADFQGAGLVDALRTLEAV
ncbi:MAG: S8 family serine peptidase [Solirubrobacterales bacterium]